MNAVTLQHYWALIAASILILGVALFVLYRLLEDSRRGRLAKALNHLHERERALSKASKSLGKAQGRLEKLQSRGDSVPPGKVLEARDAVQAADETVRLLNDQVLVVRTNARTVILEDYPPKQHAALLKRCLGETR
ncbi:MAG: hypothetical protein P8X81_10105 [Woeseiaceae bacterium]